jgi:hypothetical protein
VLFFLSDGNGRCPVQVWEDGMISVSISLRALVFVLLLTAVALTDSDVVKGAPASAIHIDDNWIQFQTVGQDATHDINVADNKGGLRFYGCPQLTLPPQCAAIQFFGNGSSGFPGQVFIDSGTGDKAAIIFRTTRSGDGTTFEHMRITSSGHIGLGTTTPQVPLDVASIFGGEGPQIRAYNPWSFMGGIGVTGITKDIYGIEGAANGSGVGVFGHSNSGIGVHGTSTSGYAAKFEGNAIITGEIRDSGGLCYAHCSISDERVKSDVRPLDPMLASLTALQPVEFSWRTDEFPDRSFSSGASIGLIAQDVEKVLPELVTETDDGYKGVRYEQLPVLLLEGVKELKAENDVLTTDNATLREQVQTLEARLAAIEQRLNGDTASLVATR